MDDLIVTAPEEFDDPIVRAADGSTDPVVQRADDPIVRAADGSTDPVVGRVAVDTVDPVDRIRETSRKIRETGRTVNPEWMDSVQNLIGQRTEIADDANRAAFTLDLENYANDLDTLLESGEPMGRKQMSREFVAEAIPAAARLLTMREDPHQYAVYQMRNNGWDKGDVDNFTRILAEVQRDPDVMNQAMNAKQQGRVEEFFGGAFNSLTRPVAEGIAQANLGFYKLASRIAPESFREASGMMEAGDIAEASGNLSEGVAQANQYDALPDGLQRNISGATSSLLQAASFAKFGKYAPAAGFGVMRTNDAIDEADAAGLSGLRKGVYATSSGLIEGVVTGLFTKFGFPGLEGALAKNGGNLTRAGFQSWAKSLRSSVLQELPEEIIIGITDAYNQRLQDVQDGPVDHGRILKDTISQTLLAVGAANVFTGAMSQGALREVEDSLKTDIVNRFGYSQADAEAAVNQAYRGSKNLDEVFENLVRIIYELESGPQNVVRSKWQRDAADRAKPVGQEDAQENGDPVVRPGPQGLPQGEAQQAIPGRRQIPGLPMRREVTTDLLTEGADTDTGLTPQEQADLPVNQVAARQEAEVEEWRAQLDDPADALKRRFARVPLRDIDHPVAQLRARILDGGGLLNDGTIEPEVWEAIPAAYKRNPEAKASIPKYKFDESGNQTARSKAAADRAARKLREQGDGVKWEDLQRELQEMGFGADVEATDNTEILSMLQGGKLDEEGNLRFPPPEYTAALQELNTPWGAAPKLTRQQLEQTPVGQVLKMFDPDRLAQDQYVVESADLEVGDIVRLDAHLYQVQEQGRVKVLQDGRTLDLEDGELWVNGVVKPDNPLYTKLRDAYNRIEALAETTAPDPDAMPPAPVNEQEAIQEVRTSLENEENAAIVDQALAEEDAARQPTTNNPQPATEPLTLEAMTPEQLEAEKDRLAAQAGKRKAEDQLNTVRKGNAGDLGQSVLFSDMQNEGDLWSGPAAENQAAARAAEPEPGDLVRQGLLEHSGAIQNELRKVGVRPQDMEDMVQEVAVRALEKAETFDPNKAQVQTWLGTLARNVAKNQFAKNTAGMRDQRLTASLQAPVGTDSSTVLQDLIAAKGPDRSGEAYMEALAMTPLENGLEADVRDAVLAGKGVADIAAEQGLTPQKVRGILRVVGRKAQKNLPSEVREADIRYGFQQKQIPANEMEGAVRDQLDFFQRLEAVPSRPYSGKVDQSGPGDLQRRKRALAKAFADPLNPKNWTEILKHGEPASYVIRELVKRPTDLAWPVAGVKINSAKDAMAVTQMLRSPYQESLKVMGLNDDNVVLGGVVHSVGALNTTIANVGNVLGQLPPGTTKVVLVHNHPSGNPSPSPADLKVSRDMQDGLNAIGLELVDHVTTDDWRYYSQKESGVVTFTKPVKSTRVPGKVVVPPERSVQEMTSNEPVVQDWSAINRGEGRLIVEEAEDLRGMADALRQGHPDASFLIGLDSRSQVSGVTLFESDLYADDYKAVKQAMAMQEEALNFILLHPAATSSPEMLRDGRNLVEAGKVMGKRVLDLASAKGDSLKMSGLVAFEPRKIYRSAIGEVRDMAAVYRTGKEKLDQAARYLNARKRGAEYQGPGVQSADPDVEERLRKAKTLEKKPWWKRENWRETARAFNRAFPELGDTQGRIIYELESAAHVSGAAEMISQSALLEITDGMGAGQMELFERILAARDVRRSIREGLYEGKPLPFGYKSPEAVDADLSNWEGQLEANPQVDQALERRRRYMNELRRELVDHKLLPEAVRDEEDYFRRLTIEYMQESENQSAPQKGLRDEKSGFQKRRSGGSDFIIDYLTAEHDVVSHAVASLQYKQIRDNLDALANKAGELKQVAKERNRAAVHGGEENYRKVRSVLDEVANLKAEERFMSEGMSNGQEIAELLATIEEIDVLRPYRALKARAVSMWEQATGEEMQGDPNEMMTAAIQGEHGEAAGYAGGQWFSAIQQEEKFIQESLGREYIRWRGGKVDKRLIKQANADRTDPLVPYAIKPGHRMFRAMSISEAVMEQVLEGHRDLVPEDVKEVLVSAGAYPEWVIPESVARALNRMERQGGSNNVYDRTLTRAVGRWKGYKLTAPWHFPKYTFNNATGDADFMLALEPKIGKYVKRAIAESYQVNIRKKMTPEMEELALRGVLGGLMRAELGGIRQAEMFAAISGENPALLRKYTLKELADVPRQQLNRYSSKVSGISKFREDILRLAAYRYYQDAIARGERPHGASNYEQVESLYKAGDMKAAAIMLARQAMIDYNNPSVFTNFTRDRFIPFATFKNENIVRYMRLMRNLAMENNVLSQETARAGAVMGARLARKAAVMGGFAFLMSAMVQAWNRMMFPEEEESLRRNNREGQMIFGVGEDGVARTVRIEGSLTAFTNALGLEEAGRKAGELASGDAVLGETVTEIAGDAASDWVNSSVPLAKTSFEAITRKQLWPDMWNPRPVRDQARHMAAYVSANHLWDRITGKPLPEHRRGIKSLQNWMLYSTDLGEMDYYYTRSKVQEYLDETNQGGGGYEYTKRNNALYYYRKAVQYGDAEAQEKYLDQYLAEGGKLKNLVGNLDKRHPLNDLKTRDDQHDFLMQLKPSDRRAYENALKWYNRSLNLGEKEIEIMSEVVKQRRSAPLTR